MQPRIDTNLDIRGAPDEWVHSACILCSNGCGMDIAVKDGRIVGVRGNARHPVNFGHLGPKGEHAWVANNSKRRGTRPMIRRRKADPLKPVGWDDSSLPNTTERQARDGGGSVGLEATGGALR